MKTVKFISFFYLIFGLLFIYHGIEKIQSNESPWLSFSIAAVAIFMFFFRRKYAKRLEEHHKTKQK